MLSRESIELMALLSIDSSRVTKDEMMNGIWSEERDGRVAINESFGHESAGLLGSFFDNAVSFDALIVKLLTNCDKTSSEFGQLPPLRFVRDTARSFESSSG